MWIGKFLLLLKVSQAVVTAAAAAAAVAAVAAVVAAATLTRAATFRAPGLAACSEIVSSFIYIYIHIYSSVVIPPLFGVVIRTLLRS